MKSKSVFTYVVQQGTFIKYSPEGKIDAIISTSGIIQLDDNIEKMVPCNGNVLIVSKCGLGELVV